MLIKQKQSGFSLLLFMVILIGMGGLVSLGYMQRIAKEVKQSQYQKNQKILIEAKRALLMYAYNYPDINNDGPGRLPCPYDEITGYSGVLSSAICDAVGRIPFNNLDLNFYDATDSSGEVLWYAVSDAFYNFNPGGTSVVNSETVGTITLFDQSGNLIYDGLINGLAAIIIAPGAVIARDENNNGDYEYTQLRGTVSEKQDPKNYMDTYGGFDNSNFVNLGNNAGDGFILGPVLDSANNTYVVNDQIIVITTDEVLTMAEKSVIQTLQGALNQYQNDIWGMTTASYRYPWLDDFSIESLDYDTDPIESAIDSVVSTRVGRIPTLNINYFSTNSYSSNRFISDLKLKVTFDEMNDIELEAVFSKAITRGDFHVDGKLHVDVTVPPKYDVYVWDDFAVPTGLWSLCSDDGDNIPELSDCARDATGIPNPGGANLFDSIVRVVSVDIDDVSGSYNLIFSDLVGSPPAYFEAPTSTLDALIFAEYDNDGFNETIDGITYVEGKYDTTSTYIPTSSGSLIFGTGDHFYFGLSYFPQVPEWVDGNDWYHSIQLAYVDGFKPGGTGNCTVGSDCLEVLNSTGDNDKQAVLILAGQNAASQGPPLTLQNQLPSLYDTENSDGDDVFEAKVGSGRGSLLILR